MDRPKDRIDFLISDLHSNGERIRVPAPALSELLVRTGHSTSQILHELTRSPRFQVEPFDTRAAIEVASMAREAEKKSSKRGDSSSTWAKVKYDRQIVAVAKVVSARVIYSEDGDIRNIAESCDIQVKGIADCRLPYAPKSPGPGLF